MNSGFWIHCIIFIFVFVITGIIYSKKMRRKEDKIFEDEYQEIQAEVLEANDLIKEAKLEKEEARKEKEKADELMRIAIEELEYIRKDIHLPHNEIRNPYQVLGVNKNDSLDIIKEVYRKLISINHPDDDRTEDDISQEQKKKLTSEIRSAYYWVLKNHLKQ